MITLQQMQIQKIEAQQQRLHERMKDRPAKPEELEQLQKLQQLIHKVKRTSGTLEP